MKTWIKLYTEVVHDRKLWKLKPIEQLSFFYMLALAGIEDDGGMLPEKEDIELELQMPLKLKKGELDAVLSLPKGKTTLQIHLEGSDGTANAAVINVVSGAMEDFNDKAQKDMKKEIDRRKKKSEESIEDIKSKLEDLQTIVPGGVEFDLDDQDLDIDMDKWLPIRDVIRSYIHGSDDWANFDFFGPIFIAIFLFVFTFITSGMSLVNERILWCKYS